MKMSHVWNGHIVRQSNRGFSVLVIERKARESIVGLGREAQKLFLSQDPKLWEMASSDNFLHTVLSGAMILQRLGQTKRRLLKLEDSEAHLAYLACAAMALTAADLTRSRSKKLLQTLNLLAMCCPVKVSFESMPPPSVMPEGSQACEAIRRQYRNFASRRGSTHDVMLADAMVLLQIFEQGQRTEDKAVVTQLAEVTQGLRTAVRQLQLAANL